MGISESAVARGTGVTAQHVPKTGGAARYLPQRIAIVAPVQTGVSAPVKFQVTGGSKQVGAAGGYKSLGYLMARELYPVGGGGVGGIPVDMIFVAPAGGAVAAAGSIAPTASAVSRNVTFVPVVGGFRGNPVTILKNASVAATDKSDYLEKVRQAIEGKLGMPVTVAHTYGSVTDTPAGGNTGDGAVTVAVASGGAPKAGTWTATCTTEAVDGGTFTIVDPDGFTVGTVPVGTPTDLGGLSWSIGDGTADWDLEDALTIEVPSTELVPTVAWTGTCGNDVGITMEGPTDAGITWAITQPTGGTANGDVTTALAQIGNTWNTLIINAFEPSFTTALDAFQSYVGNPDDETGRWAPLIRKPAVVITGQNEITVADATAVTFGRRTDNVNAIINVPGSPNIPGVIAAAVAAKVAVLANDNAPHDYGSLKLTTITPGTDAQAWDGDARELAVQRGCATTQVKDGVVQISDLITMYAPDGEQPPSLRFVVDQMKIMTAMYNFSLVFDSSDWDGKPLIADGQPTVNPEARTRASAIAAMNGVLDGLALAAVIADAKAAKAASTANISSTNPKRLDIVPKFDLAGNTNIKDVSMKWSFFYGSAA